MENIYLILLLGLGIASISGIGILVIKSHRRVGTFVTKYLTFFTAVSAGIFLVTSTLLIRETLEILSLPSALLSFALGALLYLGIHHIIAPHRHEEDHRHNPKSKGYKVLVGDAIHNIADGLLLVAAFGAGPAIGLSTALSIALHEGPQEISEFLVLKKSGFGDREAIYRNMATALTIFVGIALGIFVVQSDILQAFLLGITATFFIGIIVTDLFPIRKIIREKKMIPMFAALMLGIIIMLSINSVIGHRHGSHIGTPLPHDSNHIPQ